MLNGRRSGGRVVMFSPSADTVPVSGRSSPATILRSVVFPHPLGPSRLKKDPGGMSRSRVCNATVGPKRFETPRMLTAPVVLMRPAPVPRQARRPPSAMLVSAATGG